MIMENVIYSKIVFECPVFKVEEAEVKLPDGSTAKRWYIVKRDTAAVVCLKDNRVILTKEYRSASGGVQWRLPAGGVHEGEDPASAAIRETREEIGLEPLDLKLLKTYSSPSATTKQKIHCFLATQFKENPLTTGEKDEQYIKIKELTIQQVENLLASREIPDGIGRCLQAALNELKKTAAEATKIKPAVTFYQY